MLKVNNVNVFRGYLQILWNISLEVEEGEIVAIIGSNGAGKTTLLYTISGLIKPASGVIEFLGEQIHTLPPHEVKKRGISLVPEGRQIFERLTVLENLKMGAYTLKGDIEDSLERIYNYFPILKERKNQLAGTLSGGEQQMLVIGRALMSNPKLLMLDEPSLGLAPTVVRDIFQIIKTLNEEGVTILLVEQHVRQALNIADRGYLLGKGRIIAQGTGKELLESKVVREEYLGLR